MIVPDLIVYLQRQQRDLLSAICFPLRTVVDTIKVEVGSQGRFVGRKTRQSLVFSVSPANVLLRDLEGFVDIVFGGRLDLVAELVVAVPEPCRPPSGPKW